MATTSVSEFESFQREIEAALPAMNRLVHDADDDSESDESE